MATKKRKKTVRRSTPVKHTTRRVKTRRRRRKKGGLLSDFTLSNPGMTGAVKSTFSGVLGGITAGVIQKFTENSPPGVQIGAQLLGSVIASWGMKAPNFGAGMAGAAGILIANNAGFLSDDNMEGYQYANDIEALPMFLDENGNEMLADTMYQPGYSTSFGGY